MLPSLLDATKYIGAGSTERPDFPTAAHLLAHLDRLGIERAVVWHIAARDLHPMVGNERLIREIDATPGARDRLIPAFVVMPPMLYERGTMGQFQEMVKAHGIRAFRFFPKGLHWSLKLIGPIIRTVLPQHPVLLLDSRQLDPGDTLAFAAEFPRVPIICTQAMWPHYAALYKLLEAQRNIYVETSFLHTYRTLEHLIHHFGAERIIFGAGPRSNNGAAIASLMHAEMDEEHREQIAHRNLEGLLGIHPAPRAARPVEGDGLWPRLLRRERLGPEIIDAHAHLGRTGSWVVDFTDMHSQVEAALGSMERLGVRTMIVSGLEALHLNSLEGNAYLEEQLQPHGDRFRGYFAFNPLYAEEMIPRLDEFFSRPFFAGFKLLCDYWGVPVTDPRFAPMWEYADAHRLPVLLHTWQGPHSAPRMLREIAPKYPNAFFLLGHSGAGDRPDAEALALDNPNVFLEWCGSFTNTEEWDGALARLGSGRLIYGTDGMLHDPAWEMGRLLSIDVPDETLLPILGDNMRAILAQRR
jgi:hypothetical protein